MESKNKLRAVVFGLTNNHIFAVACVMLDLKRLSPSWVDEVVIIHDGISEKDKKILELILPSRFILYDFPLNSRRVFEAPSVRQFTKMVFSKFECLRLLDDYESVLWLDYDIVIKKDIGELFSFSEAGIKMIPGGLPVRGQLHEPVEEYDMDAEGVSAGTFVFFRNLNNYSAMREFCYSKLEEYAPILYMPEQAIFDFMIQEFNLKPEPIDGRRYSPHPTDPIYGAPAKIIHAYGQPKFWNGLKNEQWECNYKAWLDMGGSPYISPKPTTVLDRAVRKASKLISRIRVGFNK